MGSLGGKINFSGTFRYVGVVDIDTMVIGTRDDLTGGKRVRQEEEEQEDASGTAAAPGESDGNEKGAEKSKTKPNSEHLWEAVRQKYGEVDLDNYFQNQVIL